MPPAEGEARRPMGGRPEGRGRPGNNAGRIPRAAGLSGVRFNGVWIPSGSVMMALLAMGCDFESYDGGA